MSDPTKIRGFRNVSTPHQAVFITEGGEAKISQISPRRWKVLPRGGEAYEVSGKQEAIEEARGITTGLTPSHLRELQEKQRRLQSRRGRPVVKRGVRGIYEVLWYDTGAGEVRSLVNRTVVAKYTPGLGWEDHGRLPDDVREYAQQIASVSAGAGGVPHHETSGRSAPQPRKSHAQIKREVDEILAGRLDGTSRTTALPKRQIPGIAAWNMFAGGTGAAPGKHSYSLHLPEGEYHVSPVSSRYGRHRGYSLMFAARQQPRGSHGGLWHDLGMHRSPAKAAVAARKHYAASY